LLPARSECRLSDVAGLVLQTRRRSRGRRVSERRKRIAVATM
jgi:hypothetical protein